MTKGAVNYAELERLELEDKKLEDNIFKRSKHLVVEHKSLDGGNLVGNLQLFQIQPKNQDDVTKHVSQHIKWFKEQNLLSTDSEEQQNSFRPDETRILELMDLFIKSVYTLRNPKDAVDEITEAFTSFLLLILLQDEILGSGNIGDEMLKNAGESDRRFMMSYTEIMSDILSGAYSSVDELPSEFKGPVGALMICIQTRIDEIRKRWPEEWEKRRPFLYQTSKSSFESIVHLTIDGKSKNLTLGTFNYLATLSTSTSFIMELLFLIITKKELPRKIRMHVLFQKFQFTTASCIKKACELIGLGQDFDEHNWIYNSILYNQMLIDEEGEAPFLLAVEFKKSLKELENELLELHKLGNILTQTFPLSKNLPSYIQVGKILYNGIAEALTISHRFKKRSSSNFSICST